MHVAEADHLEMERQRDDHAALCDTAILAATHVDALAAGVLDALAASDTDRACLQLSRIRHAMKPLMDSAVTGAVALDSLESGRWV
jgi:hypothetical protein